MLKPGDKVRITAKKPEFGNFWDNNSFDRRTVLTVKSVEPHSNGQTYVRLEESKSWNWCSTDFSLAKPSLIIIKRKNE